MSVAVTKIRNVVVFHKDHTIALGAPNGGAETATLLLAQAIAKLGYNVTLCASFGPSDQCSSQVFSWHNITCLDLGDAYNSISAFEQLHVLLKEEKYLLIVASRAQALLESRNNPQIAARIFLSHEPSASGFGIDPRVISSVADSVICISEAQKQLLIDAGCSSAKITVVPNGVDLQLFAAGKPDERDYSRLIFVGALVVDKGLHLVVDAFRRLRNRFPKLTLDVYGSAALWGRNDYLDLEQLKQIPGLTLHGAISQQELAGVYKEAGLLVIPSIYFDAFNLVAAEAQSAGLPVVGSTHGGMKEIIIDQMTGRLTEPSTGEALAEVIAPLVSNPSTLRDMSSQALQLVRGKFDWQQTATRIIASVGTVSPEEPLKVGILTTFNQDCGLATYGRFIRDALSSSEVALDPTVTVFAENLDAYQLLGSDDQAVVRCWTRGSDSFIELDEAISSANTDVLLINCHHRFFGGSFPAFLNSLRARGITVAAVVHSIFTMDVGLQRFLASCDFVITHTEVTKLEAIANGMPAERIRVIPHGVVSSNLNQEQARQQLGIPADQEMIVCAGFIQPHKGLDEVIAALAQIRHKHPRAKLYIVGKPHREDPHASEYRNVLQQLVIQGQLRDVVVFVEGFRADDEITQYLAAANLVVLNYRSQYFESSGALALALGCGAAVITSSAPPFQGYGSAVFQATSGFPLPLAMDLVLSDRSLASELKAQATIYAKSNSWRAIGVKFAAVFHEARRGCTGEKRGNNMATISRFSATRPMRVLMLNRPNALTQRGGDTVVMERVAEELRTMGVFVDIDIAGTKNPREYDLVHLYNFATPEYTEQLAKRVDALGIPFVVTTMYEDLPIFYHQKIALAQGLASYVNAGQPAGQWPQFAQAIPSVESATRYDNAWVAEHARALIATGERERQALLRDYPKAQNVCTYTVGSEADSVDQPAELFIRETGLKDFVLCVGRLETRKNQLMLLKALEDTDLDIVFVCGDFSYQPDYEALCRQFKRAGRTIFLGRLTAEQLSSAYAAARIHVLPSWYELPGLVNLEAARRGKNVVVTDYGTAKDYFGDDAFYCEPDNADSILNAVLRAYHSVPRAGLAARVANWTWQRAAQDVLKVYQDVLTVGSIEQRRTSYRLPEWDVPLETSARIEQSIDNAASQAQEATATVATLAEAVPSASRIIQAEIETAEALCDDGDEALRSGDIENAERCFQSASKECPTLARPHRSLGVVELMRQNWRAAETNFRNALRLDVDDARALAGMASCLWNQGAKERGFEIYLAAFDRRPDDTAILLHMINAAYNLGRYEDLERCILRYLERKPEDLDIQYCLAGCYFKQRKLAAASQVIDGLLEKNPQHAHGLELRQEIEKAELTRGPLSETSAIQGPDSIIRELEIAKQNKNWEAIIELAPAVIDNSAASKEQRAYAQNLKGDALAFCGEYALAEASYLAAGESLLQRGRSLTGRAVVALSQGKIADAESLFSEALRLEPKNDAAHAGLGVCCTQKQCYEEAWDHFQRALQINGENQRALLGVIQVGYPLKRLAELEVTLRGYLELHPANIDYLYALAGCLYAQKRYREARSELDKIRLFDPMNGRAMELEGKIISQMQAMPAA